MKTITESELQRFRADTAGVAGLIHFNNAGASLPPDVVVAAVIDYLKEEALCGGYETEIKYKDELQHTYDLIARLINAEKDEVAIVENASIGWGLAFNGITFAEGDEIVTSEMEYVSNLLGIINAQKNHGVKINVVPTDDQGNFSPQELENAITPRTKLLAITHIPSSSGNVLPVAAIGKIARAHKILFLVDACQSVGQIPIDVKEIGCDMLAVTGRKYLRAPRGTGFLFVRKEVQDQLRILFMDNTTAQWAGPGDFKIRQDARRFEVFEKNRALTLGLGKAIDYALAIGLDRIWERIQHLGEYMRTQLKTIEGVTVHDQGSPLGGIVTFSVAGKDSATIKKELAAKKISVWVGVADSTILYMNKHHLTSNVRASVHYYNTEDEIRVMCGVLRG